jgi:hypothetical protein
MAGLVSVIHVFRRFECRYTVDARDKPGHDATLISSSVDTARVRASRRRAPQNIAAASL